MKVPGMGDNRVGRFQRFLEALAKEMNCPVIALISALNRSLRTDPINALSCQTYVNLGRIEQDAPTLIMFIYRDEVYNKESKEAGVQPKLLLVNSVMVHWYCPVLPLKDNIPL